MNDRLLPGEPQRLRGEPDDRVRYVHSLPLDAFRLVHGDELSWPRDHVGIYRAALFRLSRNRRMRTGEKGLMQDAARLVIRHFEPAVFRFYRTRRMMVLLTDEARNELAIALAGEMRGHPQLKKEVRTRLENFCVALTNSNEYLKESSGLPYISTQEPAIVTINQWLDELDYIKEKGNYRPLIHLHKMIADCARVWNAVFDTFDT